MRFVVTFLVGESALFATISYQKGITFFMDSTTQNTENTQDPIKKNRSLKDYAGILARGYAMGSADVVPGVSGGTMAFILGIYEELIFSIRAMGRKNFWNALLHFRIREALWAINLPFLLAVGGGIILAFLTLAKGLEWMLINKPVYIWSFFFGLVMASVITVARRVKKWGIVLVAALTVAAIGAYFLVGAVPAQTPDTWLYIFLSGALASTAMILPGISGAFILVLLGKYQFALSAVNNRDITSLLILAAGAAVGLITFAQVLGWLFRKHHDLTVAILTGFMLGSLRKLWPWKEVVEFITDSHGEQIPTVIHNVLPPLQVNGAFNMEIVIAISLAAVGFAAVLLLDRLAVTIGD
jgi:putative membrane protein